MADNSLRALAIRLLPRRVMKQVRYALERYLDWPWQRKYYSQFGEDVVLLNHLQHLAWARGGGVERGFYVDVGAYSPKLHSNTYLFYTMGWRGINIDATPGSKRLFDPVRKRDINVEAAISDRSQELIFHSWGTPDVGNTFSPVFAAEWEKRMGRPPQKLRIQTQTLASVLDQFMPAQTRIDFMSVDVEGHNLEVLRSNDWSKYQPKYIIVESDSEHGQIMDVLDSELCHFLSEKNYQLTAWIGLSMIFGLSG